MPKKSSSIAEQVLAVEGQTTRTYKIPTAVDGRESELCINFTFNNRKGHPKFEIKVHSKHISFDKAEQADFLKLVADATAYVYAQSIEAVEEWNRTQGPGANGQGDLFEQGQDVSDNEVTVTGTE